MKKLNQSGITLTALIVTIIVLLILAGITINFTIGERGIINKAQNAGEKYENSAQIEEIKLAETTNEIDEYVNNTRNNETTINNIRCISRPNSTYNVAKNTETTVYTYTADKEQYIWAYASCYNGTSTASMVRTIISGSNGANAHDSSPSIGWSGSTASLCTELKKGQTISIIIKSSSTTNPTLAYNLFILDK